VLGSQCLDRATFCFGDSHLGPTDVGTIDELASVFAGLVEQCLSGYGFGRKLTFDQLLSVVDGVTAAPQGSRDLDHYIEVQVHGPVSLADDVDQIVLDPSFAGTEVEDELLQASEQFDFNLGWHEGSELRPDEIPDNFRGPNIVELAHRTVGSSGLIDAATIGRALKTFPFTPPRPSGDPDSSHLQQYKKLWHCCLALGQPAKP